MTTISKETVKRSIQKYLQIQNRADAEVELVSINSNSVNARSPLVVVNSSLTIDQSNKARQQVELLYIIDAMADMDLSEEETAIVSGIIASNGGFYSQDDLQTVLSLPPDAEVEIDGDMVTATYPTGEVKQIQTVELIERLAEEYIQNEEIYEEKRQELSIQLDAAVKAVQSNSIDISGCKFIDSQSELIQLNRSIQELKTMLANQALTDTDNAMETDQQASVGGDVSTDAVIDNAIKNASVEPPQEPIPEPVPETSASAKLNLSKVLFIVILIVAIALITAALIFVYTSPIRATRR